MTTKNCDTPQPSREANVVVVSEKLPDRPSCSNCGTLMEEVYGCPSCGKTTGCSEPSGEETVARLIAELQDLRQSDCSCPAKLDGPWESPDSTFRTRHLAKCEFAVFVRKVFSAGAEHNAGKKG